MILSANRGPGELFDSEGSPSASSRKVHLRALKKKQMHINTWQGRGSKEDGVVVLSVVPRTGQESMGTN